MSQERYARHSLIANWKQERLAEAKVAVVGCGALGNEVLKNLGLLGVGNIWVIDYDWTVFGEGLEKSYPPHRVQVYEKHGARMDSLKSILTGLLATAGHLANLSSSF